MADSSHIPTIRIADDVHPARSGEDVGRQVSVAFNMGVGGLYNSRSHSHLSIDRRSTRRLSHDRRTEASVADIEEGDDWRRANVKPKQIFRGWPLFLLAYQSIGVIYGDIGTSILYVYSSTFTQTPSQDDLVQVLSIIIWSLTLIVTVKYVFIILNADNEGEGGTFSCYSLLTRFANISNHDPKEEGIVNLERHRSADLSSSNRSFRSGMENSKFTRGLLKAIGVLAVSMVMSDGVLTPAQSVLGAVQGLAVVQPDISSSTVVGSTCAILVVLFCLQPLGTSKLAFAFAPIVIIWLGMNAGFGIYNLVRCDWTVLRAFNPAHAIYFFMANGTDAWKMLGGILLAFTGVEAVFADLGAFSKGAIQISWCFYTFPCLLLAYIGQAAFLSVNPDMYSNPLFNSVPPGMLYPTLILAVLSAVVASQAIITATFQLISQIMKLSYCPQVKVVHTSPVYHGQIYVPFLNWLLMCGSILVTVVYSNTTRLGNAYGVCVMFVTFFDTCFVTLVALIVWRFPVWAIALPWLIFACLDGLYLSSALIKVPDGAWFTLTLSTVVACLFLVWRFGKETQWKSEAEDRFKPSQILHKDRCGRLQLSENWGGGILNVIRGFGIYFDKTGSMTPAVFTHFVSKFVSVPDVTIFFHLHPVEAPTVPEEERYCVSRFTAVPGCYRLVVKHGYMDEVISPDLAALIYQEVRQFIVRQAREKFLNVNFDHKEKEKEPEEALPPPQEETEESEDTDGTEATEATEESEESEETEGPHEEARNTLTEPLSPIHTISGIPSMPATPAIPLELRDAKTAEELARLDRAYASRVLYLIGKEQMRIKDSARWWRRGVLSVFLWIRENTRTKIANLRLSEDRVVEVGFVKEI